MIVDAKSRLHLVHVAEKASSLSDRLSGGYIPRDTIDDDSLAEIQAKLERWCQHAARGDWENFKKRLAWDDLDIDTVRRALGPVSFDQDQPLPGWLHTLDETLSSLPSTLPARGSPAEDRCLDRTAPVPFEELWLPFVRIARQRLSEREGSPVHLLSREALAALERELLSTLATIGSQSLCLEFTVFRTLRQPAKLLSFMQPSRRPSTSADEPLAEPSSQLYEAFVQYMLAGGLFDFFHEYSVAGRLAAVATDQWVNSTADFLDRLAADLPAIQHHFAANAVLGNVVRVAPGLSDPHHNGRSVIALTFATGLKLIYKPRDIGLEGAYNQLLAWLNERGIAPEFKVLQVLDRSTHGWVEFAEQAPCQDEAEAALYYHRAGMLIALIYVLHGSDCHHGNVIACGPYPVIIDLEVLLNPMIAEDIQDDYQDSVQLVATQHYKSSVLTSGLLPILHRAPDGTAHDLSSLGGMSDDHSVQRQLWQSVNTDQMVLVKDKQAIAASDSVPYLNQVPLSPNDYLEEMVAGFQQMYQFFRDNRAALMAAGGPLTALKHRRARFVFRNTSVYSQLRQFAFAPRYMKEGLERSIHFDVLSWALVVSDSKSKFWPIIKEEIRALEQMDVPLFGVYTDGDAVLSDSDSVRVAQAFIGNGYRQTISTLDHMNDADMALQSGYIRASMVTRLLSATHSQAHTEQSTLDLAELTPLPQAQLVEKAALIAAALVKSAIRSGETMTWIALEYNPELERFQLKPLGHSLYSGLSGIALFLGALARVTGEKSYRDLALRALSDLRTALARRDINRLARLGKRLGLGSAYGIGAIIYAFTRLSRLLDDSDLAEEARRAAGLLTPELIAGDRCPDVFSGSAGAILGLLAAYDQSPVQSLLDQAIACGRHLLNARVVSKSGHRAWLTLNNTLLTGFSHGAAGIAYALLRLYERAPDPQFLDAARDAIAYERSVFSPQAGNWPDLRFTASGGPVFTTTWCHGAPGIALARLGSLKLLDSEEIRQELDVALDTTRQALVASNAVDHLCCGTLGRAETLFKAGQVLSRQTLTESALKIATGLVERAEQRGSYRLFAGLSADIDYPGFFQGVSGIGYELLRFAYPDMLPSVLLWE
jgi:type 2 lantibiotic biosynthesis protein LanM